MKIPPRALNAANRIIARIPATKWTPQERDLAAAIIANETGQERALDACRKLIAVFESSAYTDARIPKAALAEPVKLAMLALNR
jgi:hypothetical protein